MFKGEHLFVILLLLPVVVADHDATLSLSATAQYETTTQQVNLNVNNFGSEDVITRITASIPIGKIVGAISYGGWESTISPSGSSILWHEGTIETNVLNALFQFLIKAGNVDQDTTATIEMITEDPTGFTETHTFQWSVLNDPTPPLFIVESPLDGGFLLQGQMLPLGANASDNETGVTNVTFFWQNCTNATNSTNLSGTVTLTGVGEHYTGTADVSMFKNKEKICYDYTALSNGGASLKESGMVTVDGQAPAVSLVSPANAATMNSQTLFRFLPTDNLAPELDCTLVVDGVDAVSGVFGNGDIGEMTTADAPEGSHSWKVRCTDVVGLQGESNTRTYFLDRTAPTITVDQPDNAVLKEGTPVTIITDDNYLLQSTQLTVNGNTTNTTNHTVMNTEGLAEGEHTIQIRAIDGAGNIADKTYTYFIDKTPPTITLLSPEDDEGIDVFANFAFLVVDNYDPVLRCTLFINDNPYHTTNTSNQTNVTAALSPGDYTWKVSCADDAENTAVTEPRDVKILDTSGPAISIFPIATILRGGAAFLSANISDFSNVSNASADVTDSNGQTTSISLIQEGDIFSAAFPTTLDSPTGTYTVTVWAVDSNGYASTASMPFDVVYGLVLRIALNPISTAPGSLVTLHGSLTYDNGSEKNDTPVNLTLPDRNDTANVSNGTFTYSFTAPSDGSYQIIASVSENGFTFTDTATLTTTTPSGGGSSGNSGGFRGFGSSNGPSGGGGGGSGGSSGGITGAASQQGSSGVTTASTTTTSTSESSAQAGAESSGQTVSTSGGTAISPSPAVGQAVGFFNLDALKRHRLALTLGALAILLAILFLLGMKGHFHQAVKGEKTDDGWDSYIERLAKRR